MTAEPAANNSQVQGILLRKQAHNVEANHIYNLL